jgi:ArsR family transcriptional regulator, arsenate/arsenite/antimonite-responsive transcriptional repressor
MMQERDRNLAEKRASVIKALAHPSRIYIVARLSSGDASVSELVDDIGSDVSTVSKHLAVLKGAGVLTDRKRGNRVLYSLRCPCIMDFIHCIDDVIVTDAEQGLACVLPTAKPALVKISVKEGV